MGEDRTSAKITLALRKKKVYTPPNTVKISCFFTSIFRQTPNFTHPSPSLRPLLGASLGGDFGDFYPHPLGQPWPHFCPTAPTGPLIWTTWPLNWALRAQFPGPTGPTSGRLPKAASKKIPDPLLYAFGAKKKATISRPKSPAFKPNPANPRCKSSPVSHILSTHKPAFPP